MPKQKKDTKEISDKQLSRVVLENGMNQAAAGRELGVTRQAIQKRIHTESVQDCLHEFLNSEKLREKLQKVAEEGLTATKIIGYIHQYKKKENSEDGDIEKLGPDEAVSNDFIDNVPDHHVRHKFWRDLMTATGKLKSNGDIKILTQNFVGSEFFDYIKGLENAQRKSDTQAD